MGAGEVVSSDREGADNLVKPTWSLRVVISEGYVQLSSTQRKRWSTYRVPFAQNPPTASFMREKGCKTREAALNEKEKEKGERSSVTIFRQDGIQFTFTLQDDVLKIRARLNQKNSWRTVIEEDHRSTDDMKGRTPSQLKAVLTMRA